MCDGRPGLIPEGVVGDGLPPLAVPGRWRDEARKKEVRRVGEGRKEQWRGEERAVERKGEERRERRREGT